MGGTRFGSAAPNLVELGALFLEMLLGAALLLQLTTVFFISPSLGSLIGVNIGTEVTNLPTASSIVQILKTYKITHVRIYNTDPHILKALSNTAIEVMVGVLNSELLGIGESPSTAAAWINKNIVPYLPFTNITYISVGSEVLTTVPNAGPVLVPALKNLRNALTAANLNSQVKLSSPMNMAIIPKSFPPSTAAFNSSWNSTMYELLTFLKNTGSPFMLNAYPYYGYIQADGIFPLDYALLRPLSPVKQIVDPNTMFRYGSMFEAMVDAAYYSIKAMNFDGVEVMVTETGWPWLGGPGEPDATVGNAETFNTNLIQRVLNGSGPPSQPGNPINTYIYELFNEDKRSGPVSEKNWGLFFANGTPVYPLSLSTSARASGNSSGLFCVAKNGSDPEKLQDGLNWACGPAGQANCSAIQQGGSCYFPDSLVAHASYAYNDYYQRMQSVGGTCDFDGTAQLTTVDPSTATCIYTGSTNSSTGGIVPSAQAPIGPSAQAPSVCRPQLLLWAMCFTLGLL